MNFVWLKSIIDAYRLGDIGRGRFIREWAVAQGLSPKAGK